MKCPKCGEHGQPGPVQCGSCRAVFSSGDAERVNHLEFMHARLNAWRVDGILPGAPAAHAIQLTELEISDVLVRMGLRKAVAPVSAPEQDARPAIPPPMAPDADVRFVVPPRTVRRMPPAAAAMAAPAAGDTESLQPAAQGFVDNAGQDRGAHAASSQPARAASPFRPAPLVSAPAHPVRLEASSAVTGLYGVKARPAKPAKPPFSWKEVGIYLLSERTLNGLLALGALLILAAAFVISTVNPTGLGPFPHLLMMVVTTLAFYGGGVMVKGKLKLARTGSALLAIGAGFIPLDSWTLGREVLLFDQGTNWFAASLLCMPVYLVSHLLLRGKPFAILSTISGASLALATANQLGVQAPWAAAALVPLSICYVVIGRRIRHEWDALAWALFWTAQVVTPLVMAALLAAKLAPDSALSGLPQAWHAALLRERGPGLEYAAGASWWLGTALYMLTARLWKQQACARAAAWLLPCSYLLTQAKAPWSSAWYGACLIPLAAAYVVFGARTIKPARNAHGACSYKDVARRPIFQVAFTLALVAAAWPFVTFESQIATLVGLAAAFGMAALLLKQRAWAYVATYLVVLIEIRQITVPRGYQDAAKHLGLDQITTGLGLALVSVAMLCIAEFLVRASGEARRPFVDTAIGLGTWRSLFGSPLFSAGYLCATLAVAFTVSSGTALSNFGMADLAGLLIVVAACGLGAYSRRTSILLYPAAALFLLPFAAIAIQVGHNLHYPMPEPSAARAVAVLALGYLALGQYLERARGHYAKPLYLLGYLTGLGAIAAAVPSRAATVEVLALAIAAYGWSALRVHRDSHPAFQWLAGKVPAGPYRVAASMSFQYLAVAALPIWLVLVQSMFMPAATAAPFGLMLALAAPAFVAGGLLLGRVRREYCLPWYLTGYALSALGPSLAATATASAAIALAVSIGLYTASAVQSRRAEWLWCVAVLTPALAWLTVSLTADPMRLIGLALVVLSLAYAWLGLRLQHGTPARLLRPLPAKLSDFAMPFLASGQVLCVAGLFYAISYEQGGLLLLALALSTVHYAVSYACCRAVFHWPLAITLASTYGVGIALLPAAGDNAGWYILPGVAAYLLGVEALLRRERQLQGVTDALLSDPPPALARAGTAPTAKQTRARGYLARWSSPFALIGHFGALVAAAFNASHPLAATAIALIYFGCVALASRPGRLYPGIGYAAAAYYATLNHLAPNYTGTTFAFATIAPVWLLFGAALAVDRAAGRGETAAKRTFPWANAWARPSIVWAVVGLAASTAAILSVPNGAGGSGVVVAGAYCLLLAVMAVCWGERYCAWGSIVYAAGMYQEALIAVNIRLVDQPIAWAAAALLAGTLAMALDAAKLAGAKLWVTPLFAAAVCGSGLAAATSLSLVSASSSGTQSLAVTFAVCGATLLLNGTWRKIALLQLAGAALLGSAYVAEMIVLHVAQPQVFSLPAGIALFVMAYLRWREDGSTSVKTLLEVMALLLVLGTALLQALGQFNALGSHYLYDTVLLLEGTAVFAVGAGLRWTRTFFAAGSAIVASVAILLADPLRNLSLVYLALLIGCGMVGLVVFMEQRRQQIPLWIDEVRLRLDSWG